VTYTAEQLAAVRGVYARPNGKFEAVVSHKSLPKNGVSKLFDNEAEARTWKLNELARLSAMAPSTLVPVLPKHHTNRPRRLTVILRAFRDNADNLSRTMKLMLDTVRSEPAMDVDYDAVTVAWARKVITGYKTGERPLMPQTIGKKITAVRLALDWYHRTYWGEVGLPLPVNPLEQLGPKFAQYEYDDPNRRENTSRTARVTPEMEAAITDVITGKVKRKCNRPVSRPADTLMLWRLLRATGLRLREAYSLRMRQLDLKRGIIRVERSKKSHLGKEVGARTLPIPTRELYLQLQDYTVGRAEGSAELIFPFLRDPRVPENPFFEWAPGKHWMTIDAYKTHLDKVTNSLSQMFAAIHADAGCPDLTTHDLRHEGVSRWCEMKTPAGSRRYTKQEVMTFTGHTTEASFARYLHYFVEDMVPEGVLG
jgi:integrase